MPHFRPSRFFIAATVPVFNSFLRCSGEDGLLTSKVDLQVAASLRSEGASVFFQPPFQFRAGQKTFSHLCEGQSKGQTEGTQWLLDVCRDRSNLFHPRASGQHVNGVAGSALWRPLAGPIALVLIAAVLCLALGIGGTTAIFSVVYAVLLRPLPYAHPEQLARIYTEFPTMPGGGLHRFWTSPAEYLDLVKYTHSWQNLDAWVSSGVNISGATEPVRATASYVTGGLFDALGVNPARGRVLNGQDDQPGAPLTAVIGYGLWQRAFGGDPNITGKDILFNNEKCTVIGVMPPGFEFPPGMWMPPRFGLRCSWTRLSSAAGADIICICSELRAGTSLENARSENGATGHALRANRLAEDAYVFEGSAPDRHVFASRARWWELFGPRCGPCSARLASSC